MNPVVVVVSASCFTGRYLCRYFSRRGKELVAIDTERSGWSGDGMFLEWDACEQGPWSLALEGAEAVIQIPHGEAVDATKAIGLAISRCKTPPQLWLHIGNADWYDALSGAPQNEWTGKPGVGRASMAAAAREAAFFGAPTPSATRKVAMRAGHIMANDPPSLFRKLRDLAAHGAGGTAGNANHRVSWMHADDFLRAIDFTIQQPFLSGIINCAAPHHPTRKSLMALFRETVGMPIGLPLKHWGINTPWITPTRLMDEGFSWRWPHPADAIADLEQRPGLDGFFRKPTPRCAGARVWLPAASR